MNLKLKKEALKALKAIKAAKRVILSLHPSPDFDSVGGVLAFTYLLKAWGKNVMALAGDSEIPQSFYAFPGMEGIIKKNYPEIEVKKGDLFLIIDSSSPKQISQKAEVKFPDGLVTIVIDHHFTNTCFGQINLVDSSYPAACQIIFDLFSFWKVKITKEMAICLMVGLYGDTGGFRYPLTSSKTFLVASTLAKINPDFPQTIFDLENAKEGKQIEYLGLALNSIEHYFGDRVALSTVSFNQLQDKGIEERHTEKMEIANMLKSAIGWEIGIVFTETEPNKVSVSLRTRDPEKYDLSKLALALGGGGHKAAAGATIRKPYKEAKKFLLDSLKKVYPEITNN